MDAKTNIHATHPLFRNFFKSFYSAITVVLTKRKKNKVSYREKNGIDIFPSNFCNVENTAILIIGLILLKVSKPWFLVYLPWINGRLKVFYPLRYVQTYRRDILTIY